MSWLRPSLAQIRPATSPPSRSSSLAGAPSQLAQALLVRQTDLDGQTQIAGQVGRGQRRVVLGRQSLAEGKVGRRKHGEGKQADHHSRESIKSAFPET